MDDALIERVVNLGRDGGLSAWYAEALARAIIPLVLEHAAKVADACERPREDDCCIAAYRHVATAIRALKVQP